MDTPKNIQKHQPDYNDRAWEEYSFTELGNFVHLLAKRSGHRSNSEKKKKDLYDARNYLTMMDAKLKDLEN
jgi:hypothetical protein